MQSARRRQLTPAQKQRVEEFDGIRRRVEALVSWLDVRVPTEDCTISVDLADFSAKCGDLQRWIRQLSITPRSDRNRTLVEKRLLQLFIEVDNVKLFHRDLTGVLERLWKAVSRKNDRLARRVGQSPNTAFQRPVSRVTARAKTRTGRATRPRR
jgi:hypothetical protein